MNTSKNNHFVIVQYWAVATSLKDSKLRLLRNLQLTPHICLKIENPGIIQSLIVLVCSAEDDHFVLGSQCGMISSRTRQFTFRLKSSPSWALKGVFNEVIGFYAIFKPPKEHQLFVYQTTAVSFSFPWYVISLLYYIPPVTFDFKLE
jgi:hypothetical protein